MCNKSIMERDMRLFKKHNAVEWEPEDKGDDALSTITPSPYEYDQYYSFEFEDEPPETLIEDTQEDLFLEIDLHERQRVEIILKGENL